MKNVAVVKTAKYIAYVVGGVVTLAKCRLSGRFVKRAFVQWLIDNIAALAAKSFSKNVSPRQSAIAVLELDKAKKFFGVEDINGRGINDIVIYRTLTGNGFVQGYYGL